MPALRGDEYPSEVLNYIEEKSEGAICTGQPFLEHLREIYEARDLVYLYESIPELISALRSEPELLRELTPIEFEEVVAEIFRSKGFVVDLTKRTRDGGKDIIAVHTDALGIRSKYFIECKRYADDNKIDVGIVRALNGVKHTKDGPNKIIIATTSTVTRNSKDFLEQEASSKWDISVADYDDITGWLEGCR